MKVVVAAPTLRQAQRFALETRDLLREVPKFVTEPERLRGLGPETIVFWVTDIDVNWNRKVSDVLHFSGARVLTGTLDNASSTTGSMTGETSLRKRTTMAASNNNGTWTLGHQEYQQLLADQNRLNALEAAGVDNWEGYGNAMRALREDDDE
ncbi:MAG TPA: hypothetical protein VFX97_20525 [Pyrinomonadaceae bacterium]|nr:hypothetical protein [Pyrinomonadaceae bacterium]